LKTYPVLTIIKQFQLVYFFTFIVNLVRVMKPLNIDIELDKTYSVKVYERDHFALPFHFHDSYELTLIIKGNGTRVVGDNIDNYKPNDLLLISPFLPHVWRSDTDNESNQGVKSITIKFSDQFPISAFWEIPELRYLKNFLTSIRRGIILKGKLKRAITVKMLRIMSHSPAKQLIDILEILMCVAESGEFSPLASDGFIISKQRNSSKNNDIATYIFDHLKQAISLNDLASAVNMHPSSVGRYFKKNMGYSPVEYINHIRIGYACKLLAEGKMNITSTCFEVGFNNLSYFNRVFLKIKGITPTHYLQKIKNS